MRQFKLFGFFLLLFVVQFVAAQNKTPKLRVLFLGNSYTYFNNLPQLISELSAKQSQPIETEMFTVGGATLKRLWEEGKAREAIKRGGWSHVVLQEQSTLGSAPVIEGVPQIADPKLFHEYARLFDREIKQAGAKTVFYMTWARQQTPEKQALLTAAYQSIAKELNAIAAPVGMAWETSLKRHPQLTLHNADKSHPNPAGSYLAACVFYATLYEKSPEGLPTRVLGIEIEHNGQAKNDAGKVELVNLNATDAATLQKIAWETVKQQRK